MCRLGSGKQVKGKIDPFYALKVYGASRGISPLIRNLPPGKNPGTHGMGESVWTFWRREKSVAPIQPGHLELRCIFDLNIILLELATDHIDSGGKYTDFYSGGVRFEDSSFMVFINPCVYTSS